MKGGVGTTLLGCVINTISLAVESSAAALAKRTEAERVQGF